MSKLSLWEWVMVGSTVAAGAGLLWDHYKDMRNKEKHHDE